MNQASIFAALTVGTAFVMAVVMCSFAWNVFKQISALRQTYHTPRKHIMENQMLTSISKVICSGVSLIVYLLCISMMFMFNHINTGLYLGSLFFSVVIGLALFFIVAGFKQEIDKHLQKIKIDF